MHLINDRNEQIRREETLLWQIQDLSNTLIRVQNELNIACNNGRLMYDETEQMRLENVLIDHQINGNISNTTDNNGESCVYEHGRNRDYGGVVDDDREKKGEGGREEVGVETVEKEEKGQEEGKVEGKGGKEREEEEEGGEEEVSSMLCTAPSPPSLLLDCHYLAPPLSLLSYPHHTNQYQHQHQHQNKDPVQSHNHTPTPPTPTPPFNQKENIVNSHISSHNPTFTSAPTLNENGEKISVSCQVENADFPVTEIAINMDLENENLRIIEQNSNLSETVKRLETEVKNLNEEKTIILADNQELNNEMKRLKMLNEKTIIDNEKDFNTETEKLTIELNENKIKIESMRSEILLLTSQREEDNEIFKEKEINYLNRLKEMEVERIKEKEEREKEEEGMEWGEKREEAGQKRIIEISNLNTITDYCRNDNNDHSNNDNNGNNNNNNNNSNSRKPSYSSTYQRSPSYAQINFVKGASH